MRMLVATLVVMTGCANMRVEHVNNASLVTSTMLLLCDSMQTAKIAGQGWPDRRWERNPIMGREPSAAVVLGYGASVVVINWAAWVLMPKRYRWILPSTVTAVQARQVQTNERYGTGWCGFGGTAKSE